jgi:hypothetical protein
LAVTVEAVDEPVALHLDCRLPARAGLLWLASLQQMHERRREPTDEIAFLGPSHALDFLGDVLDVSLSQPARSQQLGLFAAPGEKCLY